MKLFLDDVREPPDESWEVVRTYNDCIAALETGLVDFLSLDHDLGEDARTGYDVAKYIESKVFQEKDYLPPSICIHSANPVGRKNIQAAIDSIARLISRSA